VELEILDHDNEEANPGNGLRAWTYEETVRAPLAWLAPIFDNKAGPLPTIARLDRPEPGCPYETDDQGKLQGHVATHHPPEKKPLDVSTETGG